MARATPSTKRPGWCCGRSACRSTRSRQRGQKELAAADIAKAEALVARRIETRQPAAYLTGEAWLQDVPFYVDERASCRAR